MRASGIEALKAELQRRMQEAGLSEIALAEKARLPRDAVRDIFRGKSREPSVFRIQALARALGVGAGELLRETAVGLPAGEFALVRVYDVQASAGPGRWIAREHAKSEVAFRHDWLRAVTTAPVDKLVVIEADGDSMEPTINHGDHLLVDLTQTAPRRDGIYVVKLDQHVLVKRVTVDPVRRTATISSDNPRYQPLRPVRLGELGIAGRVIWIGRRV